MQVLLPCNPRAGLAHAAHLYSLGACTDYSDLRYAFSPLVSIPSGTKVRFSVRRLVASANGIGDCDGALAPVTVEVVVP